jgi:uncharacterized protein (UPF0264 family)
VTAALGDIDDPETAAALAERFGAAGTAFLKVGVAGIPDPAVACSLLAAALAGARRGAPGAELVAAAYADTPAGSLGPGKLIGIAARAGANGILVDTADKGGPGLRDLVDGNTLESWVREAHALGLSVAIAGRLGRDDLEWVARSGADIAGVRGAACRDGRTGQIEVERVRTLRALCGAPPGLAPEARSG